MKVILNNHVYIYSHPQTDLFRSIRTHQCGQTESSRSWDRNPVDSNTKPKLLTIQPRGDISCEVNFKRLWITITIVYIHPFNGCRDLNSSTKRLAIDANGNTISSSLYIDELVDLLFWFSVYQPFPDHFTPNCILNNSVKYEYSFCLHTAECQKSSISNNSV